MRGSQDELRKRMMDRNHGIVEAFPATNAAYSIDAGVLLRNIRSARDVVERSLFDYAITRKKSSKDRAVEAALRIARYRDWDTRSNTFHVTAEAAIPVALVLTSIRGELATDERQVLQENLRQKSLERYRSAFEQGDGWWLSSGLNVTIVSSAGAILTSLALPNDPNSPIVLANAIRTMRTGLGSFAPDGGWIEGPSYQAYAMDHVAIALDTLQKMCGFDFRLSAVPGLQRTGLYRALAAGNGKTIFDIGNSYSVNETHAFMYWLAREFSKPSYAAYESSRVSRLNARSTPYHILWFVEPTGSYPMESAAFHNVEQAYLVTQNAKALLKGGDNSANHQQPDLGHVMYEWNGERWLVDLGGTAAVASTPVPNFLRGSTRGHNTLTFGGQNQTPRARAKLTSFDPRANRSTLQLDSAAPVGTAWSRTAILANDGSLAVTDDLSRVPTNTQGRFYTMATLRQLSDREIIFEQNGKRVRLKVSPLSAGTLNIRNPRFAVGEPPITGLHMVEVDLAPSHSNSQTLYEFQPEY